MRKLLIIVIACIYQSHGNGNNGIRQINALFFRVVRTAACRERRIDLLRAHIRDHIIVFFIAFICNFDVIQAKATGKLWHHFLHKAGNLSGLIRITVRQVMI